MHSPWDVLTSLKSEPGEELGKYIDGLRNRSSLARHNPFHVSGDGDEKENMKINLNKKSCLKHVRGGR
jgi:hypothetical protein